MRARVYVSHIQIDLLPFNYLLLFHYRPDTYRCVFIYIGAATILSAPLLESDAQFFVYLRVACDHFKEQPVVNARELKRFRAFPRIFRMLRPVSFRIFGSSRDLTV